MKYYYNFHGIITMSVEGSERRVKHLCKQCEFFLVDEKYEIVDLEIVCGKFVSLIDKSNECDVVNRKYYVTDKALYAEDRYKTAKWKIQIEDLCGNHTRLLFDGNGWTKYIFHKSFVEVLIRYKFNQKGFFMVHSSSVSINGNGVVFPASPEAGKTSTVLYYLNGDNRFMSDDFSIIGQGRVYAYPTPITLHTHNIKRHDILKTVLSDREKFQIWWRTIVLKATMGMGDISYKVDIWNKLSYEQPVEESSPLRKMFLLTKYTGKKIQTRIMKKEEFVDRLLIVNYYETVLFDAYLNAYYYKNNTQEQDKFWNRMRDNINKNLAENEYIEIQIPRMYSSKIHTEISSLVSRELEKQLKTDV